MTTQLSQVKTTLLAKANPDKAKVLARFFKTGPGEYGEGDQFLGITVPEQRKTVKQFCNLPLSDIELLIQSLIHEERLTGLLILVEQYQKCAKELDSRLRGDDNKCRNDKKNKNNSDPKNDREAQHNGATVIFEQSGTQKLEVIYNFYIQHFDRVNNWDLVDLTASKIVGAHLFSRDRSILRTWAKSDHLWTRRISIIATHHFIRQNQFDDTLKISQILLQDPHDLIHKAVGWMLREVGKRDQTVEEAFLKKYYKIMPRTMLRYAIERFPEPLRQQYLNDQI